MTVIFIARSKISLEILIHLKIKCKAATSIEETLGIRDCRIRNRITERIEMHIKT